MKTVPMTKFSFGSQGVIRELLNGQPIVLTRYKRPVAMVIKWPENKVELEVILEHMKNLYGLEWDE